MTLPIKPFARSIDEVLSDLAVDSSTGLSEKKVIERRQEYGENVLPQDNSVNPLLILLHQFQNIMVVLLLVAAGLSWFLDHEVDAAVILALIGLNVVIGFYQEFQAEKAVKGLKHLVEVKVMVRRSGQVHTIAVEELVLGDIVLLEAGAKVPADLRLITVQNLQAMEAALTGESEPVEKTSQPVSESALIGDQRSMLFMGTLLTRGTAVGVVVATGTYTQLGKIAEELEEIDEEPTHYERKVSSMNRLMIGLAIVLAILSFIIGFGIRHFDLGQMVIYATAALISALPESLPAILVIVLAIGAQRMAKQKAIVRRLPAVETLGMVSTIMTDKTGTLTLNQMTARQFVICGSEPVTLTDGKLQLPASKMTALAMQIAAVCTNVKVDTEGKAVGDPTEVALFHLAQRAGMKQQHLPIKLVDLPFVQESRLRACLVQEQSGGEKQLMVVGAPESLLKRSSHTCEGNKKCELLVHHHRQVTELITAFSAQGLRVLALASKSVGKDHTTVEVDDLHDLQLIALVGLMDPPRPEVKSAIKTAHQAGITVIMATGDHPLTAMAIAREVGLVATDGLEAALTEDQVSLKDDPTLSSALKTHRVFARLTPTSKLRICQLLQSQGQIVAMTGDGVNDAPALKQANVGVSMGVVGTEVAREASDIVLINDNFASIIAAVKEGRTLFSNIRRTSSFLITTKVTESISLLLTMLLGFPLPLLPLQILWLDVVSGGVTDFALATEPAHDAVMKMPPRQPQEEVITRSLLPLLGSLVAAMVLVVLGVFCWFLPQGENKARTAVFVVLSLSQIFNMFTFRSLNHSMFSIGLWKNPYVNGAFLISLFTLAVAVSFAPIQRLFSFTNLAWNEVLGLVALATLIWVVAEVVKHFFPAGTLKAQPKTTV